jgi:phenylacetate-coenzyme A ligase PaaK-like adenylate-forming protein
MAEVNLEIELVDGANEEAMCHELQQAFHNTLGLRPNVTAVPRNSLPRFELKAKRFYLIGD